MRLLVSVLSAVALSAGAGPLDFVDGTLLTLKANGGWSWFSDDRALVLPGDRLVTGSVAGVTARGSTAGDCQVTAFDLAKGTGAAVTLHAALERDDHDYPALLPLPGGRLLAVYQKHGTDRLVRWRVAANDAPGDPAAWSPERTIDAGGRATYANLFRVAGSGGKPRIYDFHRGANFNPNFLVCDDDGATFAYGGRFLTQGTGRTRPYVRYAAGPAGADGLPDAVHFIATEGHPRDVGNSIYAGVVRAGKVCGSDGKPVAALGDAALAPAALTRVFAGDADRRAWSTDIEVDAAGRPYAAFSVRHIEAGRTTLWFYYARWTGDAWAVHRLAHAGSALYAAENDYTGLVALDPHDPDFCVLSTNADPASGRPLVSAADGKPHHELFTARTADRGRTWTFVPLTADSRADNLRPVIPRWPPAANAAGAERRRAIVWMRGTYRTYADYDTDLVAVVQRVAAPRR